MRTCHTNEYVTNVLHMRTTNCYVCVHLYAYVTHRNVNLLHLRTEVQEVEFSISGTITVTDLFLSMHVFI